jgi:hypothetical protein
VQQSVDTPHAVPLAPQDERFDAQRCVDGSQDFEQQSPSLVHESAYVAQVVGVTTGPPPPPSFFEAPPVDTSPPIDAPPVPLAPPGPPSAPFGRVWDVAESELPQPISTIAVTTTNGKSHTRFEVMNSFRRARSQGLVARRHQSAIAAKRIASVRGGPRTKL